MLEAWIEWKRRCALGLCENETREHLAKFAYARFDNYLKRYAHRTNLDASDLPTLQGSDAWHLVETQLVTANTGEGKRYKDWLFDRANGTGESALGAIESGATLLLRSVVKELLRREFSPPNMLSSSTAAFGDEYGTLTIEDLLPGSIDPVDEVAAREFKELAQARAGELFSSLAWREKLVLFAKCLGLSLAHPEVEAAAECRKSVLNACYRDLAQRIAGDLSTAYPEEERDAVLLLAMLTLNECTELTRTWGKSEKRLARFFTLTGE